MKIYLLIENISKFKLNFELFTLEISNRNEVILCYLNELVFMTQIWNNFSYLKDVVIRKDYVQNVGHKTFIEMHFTTQKCK